LYSLLYGHDLGVLAQKFGTDKNDDHYYTYHYQQHFSAWRRKKFNLLEIGIGGYDKPSDGGQSLRMWKAFFPYANIYGLDIYVKSYHDEDRIKTYIGSQTDEDLLKQIVKEAGGFDIIIDDGSHLNEHIISTFKILFPLLNSDGIYAIEDLQTSYWEQDAFGINWGGSRDLQAPFTCVNFLKTLIDCLNYEEFMIADYTPSYFDMHIRGVAFYHNLAFITKGINKEGGKGLFRLRGW
ncbi:MAG: class I SAM-dependent methyltransferase, partial [Cyanobacteriota bacterium]